MAEEEPLPHKTVDDAGILEAGPDPHSTSAPPDAEPSFSVFSQAQKRWIILLAAFAGMFSPMSSFIFYPAITSIANDLSVTVDLVNLAVTTYMIVSGLVPALLGNAADNFGRRPIYLLALVLYLAANLGLALQNTYAGLLVLRMLQSAGSSGTISLGYGVIADITTRANRGSYVGILLLGPNVAPPTGPVLGGVLASKLGWKWIFWFLCILGGACLLLIFVALPETSRVIVGNGSVPARGIYRSLIANLVEPKKQITRSEKAKSPADSPNKRTISFPNPLACLKLLLEKDVAAVLLCNGIYYAIYCCIQASLSTLFIEVYGYNSLEAGLIYLPFGIACLASVFTWGKLLNYDYKRIAKRRGMPTNQTNHDNIEFPIETARLQSSLYLVAITTIAVIAYGWVIQFQVHVAAPLFLQALIGFATSGLFVALGTLLTDLNPTQSSTAAASANLVRCALAAAMLAVLQPMIDGIGVGWTFTIFGAMSGVCGPIMVWEMRCGNKDRRRRATK